MTESNIRIKCGRCNGTGVDDNTMDDNEVPIPKSCISCGGDGWLESFKVDTTDIMDDLGRCKKRLKKIMDHLGIGDDN